MKISHGKNTYKLLKKTCKKSRATVSAKHLLDNDSLKLI